MQPQGHTQMLLNNFLFGMDIQEAINATRFRHFSKYKCAIEGPVDDNKLTKLENLGHEIIKTDRSSFGGAQAIMKLSKGWAAGSDARKDGMAIGY